VRRRNPGKLIVAVPVAAADTCDELRQVADQVVCPHEIDDLGAIGYHYVHFEPVEDEKVKALLDQAHPEPAATGAG
jgi:putative phosphoribosyl transferase